MFLDQRYKKNFLNEKKKLFIVEQNGPIRSLLVQLKKKKKNGR